MYSRFFELSDEPFHVTPDPAFLYLSPGHREAYASLLYGIQARKGFLCVTGEVGAGKTTVLRASMAQLDPERARAIHILFPELTAVQLFRTLLDELGGDGAGTAESELVAAIQARLVEHYRAGTEIVLVIDEAQRMPVATLESLRLLSNLETDRDKLMQIVLLGQPELDQILSQHELRPLTSRLALRAAIPPLSFRDSIRYIEHRVAAVSQGGSNEGGGRLFTRPALWLLARKGRGNPRSINILCDNALITAFGLQKRRVTRGIAREAMAPYARKPSPSLRPGLVLAASILGLVAIGAGSAWLARGERAVAHASVPDAPLPPVAKAPAPAVAVGASAGATGPAVGRETPPAPLATATAPAIAVPPPAPVSVAALPPPPVPSLPPLLPPPAMIEKPMVDKPVAETKAPRVQQRTVQRGDTLYRLVRDAYGDATPEAMTLVMKRNNIDRADIIETGRTLVFPPLTEVSAR